VIAGALAGVAGLVTTAACGLTLGAACCGVLAGRGAVAVAPPEVLLLLVTFVFRVVFRPM